MTIYKSQTFSTGGIGYNYKLHPKVAQKVREAFFSFELDKPHGTPTSMSFFEDRFEQSADLQVMFMPITYKEHFAVIRMIDKALGTSHDCQ